MKKIEEIEELQNELDERQKVIDKATNLISQGKFEEAIDLLNTI